MKVSLTRNLDSWYHRTMFGAEGGGRSEHHKSGSFSKRSSSVAGCATRGPLGITHQLRQILLPQRRIASTAVPVCSGSLWQQNEASTLDALHQVIHRSLLGSAGEVVFGV